MVAGRPVLDGAVPGGRASCFTGYWVGLDWRSRAEEREGKDEEGALLWAQHRGVKATISGKRWEKLSLLR